MEALSPIHRDFLLQAPREELLGVGSFQGEGDHDCYYNAVAILGGRFAILEVHYTKKDKSQAALPTHSVVEIVEADGKDNLHLGMICIEEAQKIHSKIKEFMALQSCSKPIQEFVADRRKGSHLRLVK